MHTIARVLAPLLLAALLTGCAQNSEQRQVQPSNQSQPTRTEQDTRSAGGTAVINVIQHPSGFDYETSVSVPGAAKRSAKATSVASDGSGNGVAANDATYVQSGLTVNVTFGNNSQNPTGSASASASQSPAMNAHQDAKQEPRANVTVPIAVGMPGSAPNASAAGSLEGPASNTPTATTDLRTAILRGAASDPSFASWLQALFAPQSAPVPATQPSAPPQ